MPWWAAVVAAPMRKLWPQYCDWSMPLADKPARSDVTKWDLVRGRPSFSLKRGPWSPPLLARYASIAMTGQRSLLVRPINIEIPLRNGSVFEAFRRISITVGDVGLSRARSLNVRCVEWSNASWDGTVISPTLRNPKKHVVDAAHSIAVLWFSADWSHVFFSCRRMHGVIGSRGRGCVPCFDWDNFYTP